MSHDDDVIDLEDRRRRGKAGLPMGEVLQGSDIDRELRTLPSYNPTFQGVEAGEWRGKTEGPDGLPKDCPVTPLGWDDEGFWFLSGRGHLFALGQNAGKGNIDALFTPYANFPVWAWPRRQKSGKSWVVKGNFEAEECRKDLFKAVAWAGPYDPMKKVRGRGAWRDEDTGGLIVHLGDVLITPEGVRACGVYKEKAYPVGPALPPPAKPGSVPEAAGDTLPGQVLFSHLLTWNWARGEVDARLMLGWMADAMVGGCLRWRPYIFGTGDAGAGKSTLVEYICHVLGGEDAVLKPEDATEAGIAQTLGVDSVPVLLDEAENEADDRRAEKLVKLARRAASGNQRLRGGADGKSTLSVIRSCFAFFAINAPTMNDQDMSRMAMLAMRPIPRGQRRMKPWSLTDIRALGRAVHRQMIDWFQVDRESGQCRYDVVVERFREGLIVQADHNDRGADTFGFLLAGYWCATQTELPDEADIAEMVTPLHRDTLAELEDFKPGWRKCFDFLMDVQPKALERQRWTSVRAVLEAYRDGDMVDGDGEGRPSPISADDANKQLKRVGLRLQFERSARPACQFEDAWLYVPNGHPALAPLFDRTDWAASNPSAPGSWKNALRGADSETIEAAKDSGTDTRGSRIRLARVMKPRKGMRHG